MSDQNDWHPLDPYNLPPDILKPGAWEIEWFLEEVTAGLRSGWYPNNETVTAFESLKGLYEDGMKHRIRRKEPEAPSYECLAEEYVKHGAGVIAYGNVLLHADEIESIQKRAFIAGCKATDESEESE